MQRFSNFIKALKKLEEAVHFVQHRPEKPERQMPDTTQEVTLKELITQGLIQSFEFTHELAWNVVRDYAAYQGNPEIKGSRDAARAGFAMGLIENGEVWMEMIKSRNETSHTYDEDTANAIYQKIIHEYLPAFVSFKEEMESYLPESAENSK